MKIFTYIAPILLAGCTSMASLKPSTSDQYFTLTDDATRVKIRGLLEMKWVEGIRAGTYTATAEDDDGTYFQGAGRSVILLPNQDAEIYLISKSIPAYLEADKRRSPPAVSPGGIWVPKPGVSKPYKLFYEEHPTSNGSVGGITGMAIASLVNGTLAYIPLEAHDPIIEKIHIIAGKPSAPESKLLSK